MSPDGGRKRNCSLSEKENASQKFTKYCRCPNVRNEAKTTQRVSAASPTQSLLGTFRQFFPLCSSTSLFIVLLVLFGLLSSTVLGLRAAAPTTCVPDLHKNAITRKHVHKCSASILSHSTSPQCHFTLPHSILQHALATSSSECIIKVAWLTCNQRL